MLWGWQKILHNLYDTQINGPVSYEFWNFLKQFYIRKTSNKSQRQSSHRHLIIVGIIEIFFILLVLLHLVPNRPLPWGGMPIIHWIIGITSRTNIWSGGETSRTEEKSQNTKLGIGLEQGNSIKNLKTYVTNAHSSFLLFDKFNQASWPLS